MSQLEELCTIKQACFSEKAGRTTIYQRIKDGHYKAYKIGGSTRLTIASLKAYRKVKPMRDISLPIGNLKAGAANLEVAAND